MVQRNLVLELEGPKCISFSGLKCLQSRPETGHLLPIFRWDPQSQRPSSTIQHRRGEASRLQYPPTRGPSQSRWSRDQAIHSPGGQESTTGAQSGTSGRNQGKQSTRTQHELCWIRHQVQPWENSSGRQSNEHWKPQHNACAEHRN